jgi:flagellar biosynthesis GTPase FlhF
MQIHRIHGRDLREALERAGRLHGTDAVLLGHEQVASGVTVAVAGKAPPAGALPASAPARSPAAEPPPRQPGLADVERALARSGCSPGLLAAVLEEIEAQSERGPFALDRAAEILGARAAVAPSPKIARGSGRTCALALVGARRTGVTTTLTKLAGHLVRQRRRVALVGMRGGAAGEGSRELEKYALVLQVPFDAVQNAAELVAVLERSRSFDAVLLDGTGTAGNDVALLREARALDPRLRLEVYLTLPATAYRGELEAIAADYAAAAPSAVVLTQLDRTRAPAPALELAIDAGLPLAFLCDGPDVARHLHRPTSDMLADLFLRGRLA